MLNVNALGTIYYSRDSARKRYKLGIGLVRGIDFSEGAADLGKAGSLVLEGV